MQEEACTEACHSALTQMSVYVTARQTLVLKRRKILKCLKTQSFQQKRMSSCGRRRVRNPIFEPCYQGNTGEPVMGVTSGVIEAVNLVVSVANSVLASSNPSQIHLQFSNQFNRYLTEDKKNQNISKTTLWNAGTFCNVCICTKSLMKLN